MESGRICAFVPARAGSQGVKGKNWRELGDKPLLNWTLDFALSCQDIAEIYLSSDSQEVFQVARSRAIKSEEFRNLEEDSLMYLRDRLYFHKRRSAQAQTLSLISEVLFDFVTVNKLREKFEFLLLLQPTSPFRKISELNEIKRLTCKKGWSSIVSLRDIGGMHPDRMYKVVENQAMPFVDQTLGDNRPRQLLERLFIKDGAYYLLRIENLLKGIMLGERIIPFIREGLLTINIDTEEDFFFAETVASNLVSKKINYDDL